MEYEIRNPKTATVFFWWAPEQCWLDVLSCGDLSIPGWVALFRRIGCPICKVKRRAGR